MLDLTAYQDLEFPADQPEMLVLMRAVQEFPIEPTVCPEDQIQLRGLRNMWANQYVKFKADLEKLELEWLQWKAQRLAPSTTKSPSEAPVWDGKGACPVCKREPADPDTVAARERGLKWLREHGDE